jgi:molybdopterin/thiamine biosynthesis adenylyltransferase/ubiquitin-protein ligase
MTPYQTAVNAVATWLDGYDSSFFLRTRSPDPRQKVASWTLELEHPSSAIGRRRVRLTLPKDFPARAPELHFDKELCLALPHIEEDGRFCHSVRSDPADYDGPCRAVVAVIDDLRRFWANSSDPNWVATEFQEERLSYWRRFCERVQEKTKLPVPIELRVSLAPLEGATEGGVALYVREGRKRRAELLVAAVGDADPHTLSVRHGWSVATLVRGHALFVPMPEDEPWTPRHWPQRAEELEELVGRLTDHECSVRHWVETKHDNDPHPFVVVLVQGSFCYGYMLTPALIPGLTGVGVVPVSFTRVDADWALSRDHELPQLRNRRGKRALLLGCGSLGAPVAEILARAGVGELHLLDREAFEPENCARHILGASEVSTLKSKALAEHLRRAVPGLIVKYHYGLVTSWMPQSCKPGDYDVVLDCTGESAVREMLCRFRRSILGQAHVVHAWLEPFGAAAHVLFLDGKESWPAADITSRIDAAKWPENARVAIPACNAGFHPYGVSDAWQAASLAAEKVLGILDGRIAGSTSWSTVRGASFFGTLPVAAELNAWARNVAGEAERVQVERRLDELSDE